MPFTLEDIARISGVSRSTVSRVVNGDANVRADTRQKVMAVIQQNDFHPNLAARRLAAGRTNVLGLVIPTGVATIFTDPYFPQLIQGVSATCNAQDHSVMLWLAEPDYERRMAGKILNSGMVDGVIVSSMLMDDPIVRALFDSRMPFILIGRHPGLDVNYLDMDNIQGGTQATLHLLRLSRKRVATVTGPQTMVPGLDRYQGYLVALAERNIPLQPELVAEGDFTEAGGYMAMRQLLPANPDAVFAASDMMAQGAIRAIKEVGLHVPDDIAVVGYDDMPAAALFDPPLTTIRQPVQKLGMLAVETLIDIIQHPNGSPRRVLLSPELIIRTSCGAVK